MKRILIIDQHQFGYLTDTYCYCRHLAGRYDITYVSWDFHFPPMSVAGVRIITVSRDGSRVRRVVRYLRRVREELRTGNYDVAFVVLFTGCSLLRLVRTAIPLVVDLRTGSELSNRFARWMQNSLMAFESRMFRHISVISEGLREVLGFSVERCHILPLGADPQNVPDKSFHELRLLYVGTLIQRHVERTVEGLHAYLQTAGAHRTIHYDIVGDGLPEHNELLKETIRRLDCASVVTFHGRVPFAELRPFLERCNIGVAFVPMTPYFHPQPSTKIFEYLLAGMPVLATATDENARVVTPSVGVLHKDTAEDFCRGLTSIIASAPSFTSASLRSAVLDYTWENIVHRNLEPFLLRVAEHSPVRAAKSSV
jgi:glycosyltransferase involved in cell wall biosynthesis